MNSVILAIALAFWFPRLKPLILVGLSGSIGDYFGLPTVGQVGAAKDVSHSALPLRAYNLIFNEWFRDENLVPSLLVNTGDGPDIVTGKQIGRAHV